MKPITTIITSSVVSLIVAVLCVTLSVTQTPPPVGAIVSPDIASQYLSWGGVKRWSYNQTFQVGTTTLCAIKSPVATSTLKTATAHFSSLTSYTQQYELGMSSTKNSTTTALVAKYNPTTSLPDVVSTTTVTALTDGLVAPNTWLNFNMSTSTASGAGATSTALTGNCTATFEQL